MIHARSAGESQLLPSNRGALQQGARRARAWLLWFLAILGLTAGLGFLMLDGGANASLLAWLLYLAGAVVVVAQPRYGLYLIIFLALVGDRTLTIWYPFVTNFSSRENLMFLADQVIVSPFETYLVLTTLSWFIRTTILHRLRFHRGELFWPVMAFLGFIVYGFAYGMARGGNLNVALWEIRPIVYLAVLFMLTGNLIDTRKQVNILMWLIMFALFIKGITGTYHVAVNLNWDISSVQDITEHGAAIHFASFFLFTLGAWIFRDSLAKRVLLPLMAIPVLISFVATQRRAGFLAVIFALILIAVILYREKKIVFWMVVPAAVIVFTLYTVAFWDSQGVTGLPVRAIKSQIAPGQMSARDQSSNSYRMMENYNIVSTIHRVPLTGIGFGHMFDMVVALPDISFFVWWRYITHNSILWIWMNTGIGGFMAMLLMIGTAIMVGARAFSRMPRGILKTAAFSASLYIVMHFLYAYVDMSWENQSMIYVGAMMGLAGSLERIAAKPVEDVKRRASAFTWLFVEGIFASRRVEVDRSKESDVRLASRSDEQIL